MWHQIMLSELSSYYSIFFSLWRRQLCLKYYLLFAHSLDKLGTSALINTTAALAAIPYILFPYSTIPVSLVSSTLFMPLSFLQHQIWDIFICKCKPYFCLTLQHFAYLVLQRFPFIFLFYVHTEIGSCGLIVSGLACLGVHFFLLHNSSTFMFHSELSCMNCFS